MDPHHDDPVAAARLSRGRPRTQRRLLLPALTGLLLAGLLAGCVTEGSEASSPRAATPSPDGTLAPPTEEAEERGTFRYGSAEPAAILPSDVVDTEGAVVVDAVFDSLTAYRPDGTVGAAAAVDWESDETLTEWRFRLRDGATFHDGTPVTATDFVMSWTRTALEGRAHFHLEEVSGYRELRDGAATTLTGVSAPDPLTFVVRLSAPLADFPAVAAHPALGPVPHQRVAAEPQAYAADPAGNGPYQVESWERGAFLRLTRYPEWRNGRGRAGLDEVLVQFEDADTAYIAFQQGRRDYAPLPPGALAEAVERYGASDDGYRGPGVLNGRSGQLYFLGMNLAEPPFDDPDVRRALSLAIDRRALAGAVREGNADPAAGAVPRALPGARAAPCDHCRYDPERARELFTAAGVTELELWLNREGGHEQIASLLAAQLADVGVSLRTRAPQEPEPGSSAFQAYLDRIREGEARLFRFGWTLEYPTLDDALYPLFASGAREGGANLGGYAQADVDALFTQARAEADGTVRRRYYQQIEDLALNRDQAIVPLLTFRHAAVVSDRFEGFALSPLGLPDLAAVRPAPPSTAEAADDTP